MSDRRAIAFRLPEDLIERAKRAALLSGQSTTAFVASALEAKLDAPSILDVPMTEADLVPTTQLYGPRPDVPRDTPQPDVEVCAHPFTNAANVCLVCGAQR